MQDSLKDLSDRQLMQTMEAGSSPQYLVLAEMQRRKKMREDSAQAGPQGDRSVAEDIISGIAAVPTSPMGMAEGGIVSFAKGGKTGRMKGEEEACYVDSRTGEKYCPPSRPQTEMPRTGQRKSFAPGGDVGISPDEMAGIEVDRRLQELRQVNPNATRGDAAQSLLREGSTVVPPIYDSGTSQAAQSTPAAPMSQPEAMPENSVFAESQDQEPTEDQGFLRRAGQVIGSGAKDYVYDPFVESFRMNKEAFYDPTERLFYQTLGGIGEGVAGLYEGATGEEVSPNVEALIEDVKDPYQAAADRAAAGDQAAGDADGEGTSKDIPKPDPDKKDDEDDKDDPIKRDGLMELYEQLQRQQVSDREQSRQDAINQALIRGGLTMAASDNPDFLSAAAEGGIGGLAGYQSVIESAADRQAESSEQMKDLLVAREANDIRRQVAQARAAGSVTDTQFKRINALNDMIEETLESVYSGDADPEEVAARVDMLRKRRDELMGIESTSNNPDRDASGFVPNQ